MAFAANAFAFSLFFLSSIASVYGTAPVPPPVQPPLPPVKPPVYKVPVLPPVKPVVPPVVAPVKPPVAKPPVKPPVAKPPVLPPVKPPTYKWVKPTVVQGVVYCKACKYRGINTLLKATPLLGAVVKLVCNDTKTTIQTAKADKNGYFFFIPKNLTPAGSRKCRAFLVSSPLTNCSVPTNLHGGATGGSLFPAAVKPPVAAPKKKKHQPIIYNILPFAYEPSKKLPCKY